MNALRASAESSLWPRRRIRSASRRKASENGIENASFRFALIWPTASGWESRSRSAIARTPDISSSAGNTPFARPIPSACSAPIRSGSRYISRARPRPTSRGNVQVPPKSPDTPTFRNAVYRYADSDM